MAGRIDTEGAMSDYWDLESSHMADSQHMGQIGKITSDEHDYSDVYLRQNSESKIDAQLMIQDPSNKAQRFQKKSQLKNQSFDASYRQDAFMDPSPNDIRE